MLYLGARDFLDSRIGQREAAREFARQSEPVPPTLQPPVRHAAPPPPKLGDPVAKLIIPRLDTELYVVEGDGPRQLRRGPGHLAGSAMPGENGNCIIAAHRDTHFRVLKDIRPGDDIFLKAHGATFIYRVKKTQVVSPDNTHSLRTTPDAELHLITCYPFYYVGSAPKRFVVQARLTGSTPPAS